MVKLTLNIIIFDIKVFNYSAIKSYNSTQLKYFDFHSDFCILMNFFCIHFTIFTVNNIIVA